jgi:hypothetical protein
MPKFRRAFVILSLMISIFRMDIANLSFNILIKCLRRAKSSEDISSLNSRQNTINKELNAFKHSMHTYFTDAHIKYDSFKANFLNRDLCRAALVSLFVI